MIDSPGGHAIILAIISISQSHDFRPRCIRLEPSGSSSQGPWATEQRAPSRTTRRKRSGLQRVLPVPAAVLGCGTMHQQPISAGPGADASRFVLIATSLRGCKGKSKGVEPGPAVFLGFGFQSCGQSLKFWSWRSGKSFRFAARRGRNSHLTENGTW